MQPAEAPGSVPATIRLTIPLPPSANRYWRHARGRSTPYLSPEAKAYIADVRRQLAGMATIGHPVAVRASVYMERRACDLDNRWKIAGDALERATALADDVLICALALRRRLDARNPRIELTIRPVRDPALLDALDAKLAKAARAAA